MIFWLSGPGRQGRAARESSVGVRRRNPAGEHAELVVSLAPGSGGVAGKDESFVSGGPDVEGVVREVHGADDGVVEMLEPGVVVADIMGTPADTEIFTASGEFADQLRETLLYGSRPASVRSSATVVFIDPA
jgi:hypothetical protein